MRDVKITCRRWDGHAYDHFLSSCTTDVLEGRDEFSTISDMCDDHPLEKGYAYEYMELEDGVPLPTTIRIVYHANRNDLF